MIFATYNITKLQKPFLKMFNITVSLISKYIVFLLEFYKLKKKLHANAKSYEIEIFLKGHILWKTRLLKKSSIGPLSHRESIIRFLFSYSIPPPALTLMPIITILFLCQ